MMTGQHRGQQPQQQQGVTRTHVVVTAVDDDNGTRLYFIVGTNLHRGPPDRIDTDGDTTIQLAKLSQSENGLQFSYIDTTRQIP